MICGILLAAGQGARFGGYKQFAPVAGIRCWERAYRTALTACDHVVVVGDPDRIVTADHVVAGGATRSGSVRGLAAVPTDASIIVVHDAVRPLARPDLWMRVIDAARHYNRPAVPTVPIVDSIRHCRSGLPADRDDTVAVQTPQAFPADMLRAAHADDPEVSDDASMFDTVEFVPGEPTNIKITYWSDLAVAAALTRVTP